MPLADKESENYRSWVTNVENWKKTYGLPANYNFNPINVTVVKRCVKCNSVRKRMARHHKGHEYLFACILPHVYAARYIQFLIDDVAWLCDRCHTRIHTLYKPIVDKVYGYIIRCNNQGKEYDVNRLEAYRKEIIRIFVKWVAYRKKKKRKKRRVYDRSSR
jgi:hypothetical protein